MTNDFQVTIIGAGKVGSHLAGRCKKVGIKVLQVYNRDADRGKLLARRVGAEYVESINQLDAITPQLIFLAVKDEAISDVANALKSLNPTCLVVHVSGVHLLSDLSAILPRAGGFYPLMTINTLAQVPWRRIPVGVSAVESTDLAMLKALADKLAGGWFHLQDYQRTHLHIAAVLANNFTNQLLAASFSLLKDADLEKQILEPLLHQTLHLAMRYEPVQVQTGPAARGDSDTIERHLAQLQLNHPEYLELYEVFTKLIQKQLSGTDTK